MSPPPAPPSVQPATGDSAHWLATQAASRQALAGVGQSLALLQQPADPVEPKTQRLSVHAVAAWHAFDGVQSLGRLQQGDAPAATNPQFAPSHEGVWHELPAGHAVHIAPQVATALLLAQVPLQSCDPELQ